MRRRMALGQTTSSEQIWIRASPRGTRSGFAVLEDGRNGVVTVTVLPKPWAHRPGVLRDFDHAPGSTTHIVIYETETALIRSSSAGAVALSLAALARGQADLLELGSEPEVAIAGEFSSADPFKELIDVMVLAQRSRVTSGAVAFEGALAPSLLRLLSQERFLNEIEPLLFRARPRYEERSEALSIPRGRLNEQSLLFSMATGVPLVESAFDELTMDTPLLRIVASTLRVVATDRLPLKIMRLRPGLRSRAILLLRHLDAVGLIQPEQALILGESLWLGSLDRSWQFALDAALPVLRSHAVAPEYGTDANDGLLVHVSMEKFWEECLEVALESAFSPVAVSRDASPGQGVEVPRPWTSQATDSGGAFPDFMVRTAGRVVLADAKYKMNVGAGPSSQDGYQLFAYSHLATLNGRASDAAVLFYPARSNAAPGQAEVLRMRDVTYPLWLVTLPFPDKSDVRSAASWGAYIARLAALLRDFSGAWRAPKKPPESAHALGEI